MAKHRFNHKKFRVESESKIKLRKISTEAGKELSKECAAQEMQADLKTLSEYQEKLFSSGRNSLLIIFQGMDASGKDGTVRHVMSGINPQGCRVYSFRAPNSEEVQHHFLWRPMRFLPERGLICIFNRSYYEETIVVRVHPEFLNAQMLPPMKNPDDLWEQRFEEIRNFEETLSRNGTKIIKFFLHVSRDEQKMRLLERMKEPEKNWKFNERDLVERGLWADYENAFEAMLPATSTKKSPWYIIPADDKWYARAAVADIIAANLQEMNPEYPVVSEETRLKYAELAKQLEASE